MASRAACFVQLGTGLFQYRDNFSVSRDRNFPNKEINFGLTVGFSWTHGAMPPINLRVELKACFCQIKWLASNIRHKRKKISYHVRIDICMGIDGVGSFPTNCVKIWRNLIGWPLLRVVNNSDRWMGKAWEWREASHMVRTRFGTRLLSVGDRLFRSSNSTTISQVMMSIGPNQ